MPSVSAHRTPLRSLKRSPRPLGESEGPRRSREGEGKGAKEWKGKKRKEMERGKLENWEEREA